MGFLPQRLLFDNDDSRARRLGARRPGTTFPAGPVIGDLFYETDTSILWVWNGTIWAVISGQGVVPGTTNFLDGIELYQPSSTPYIDFHASANPAGDGNADYKSRLIMGGGASGRMDLTVGNNYTFSWYSDGEFDAHHIGVNGDNDRNVGIKITTGTNGVGLFFDNVTTDNKILFYDPDYKMGVRGGTLFFGTGDIFDFQRLGSRLFYADNNQISLERNISIIGKAIWTKAYNDNAHRLQYSAGLDSMEYWTWTEHRFICNNLYRAGISGSELFVGDGSNMRGHFYKFDQLGDYGVVSLLIHSAGGGTGDRIGFWSQGQNAAQIIKNWNSTIEIRSWDDVGWGTLSAVINNTSSRRFKENIKKIQTTKEARQERRDKHSRVKISQFNRKHATGCPNCRATGITHKDAARHVEGLNEGDPCPDCNATGHKGLEVAQRKSEESGWYGFIAEDLAVEFPEAIFYDDQEQPQGVDSLAVSAILWDRVHDLEERLSAIETKK